MPSISKISSAFAYIIDSIFDNGRLILSYFTYHFGLHVEQCTRPNLMCKLHFGVKSSLRSGNSTWITYIETFPFLVNILRRLFQIILIIDVAINYEKWAPIELNDTRKFLSGKNKINCLPNLLFVTFKLRVIQYQHQRQRQQQHHHQQQTVSFVSLLEACSRYGHGSMSFT